MSAPTGPLLLVAGDAGPHETLRPLLARLPAVTPDPSSADAPAESYWTELMRSHGARGLVCGTSDSPAGRAPEAAARRAAVAARIPAVAIEDFPGNYYDVPDGAVDLLVVESAAVASLACGKFGAACPRLTVMSPARYDGYRREAGTLRARVRERWADATSPPAILWAGQPETQDCVRTLEVFLPLVRARRLELLFKAHPRDPGHGAGAYAALLARSGVRCRDVTAMSVAEALALAPRLVVTQFSSVAVDAGFHGIPSVSVLLDDAGRARLLAKKGYDVPPYCAAGAAAIARDADEAASAFSRALDDPAGRENILHCFDAYFQAHAETLPALVSELERLFRGISS